MEKNLNGAADIGRPKPILLLEINEVPWKLLDLYRATPGFPNIARFLAGCKTYTTVTVDSGHLSPWVTWPSLHRGMPDQEHGVANLGQDPSTFRGVPIWEEYRKRGHSIGVFGSLQSWPPMDPGKKGFYLPDTFAHDESAYPAFLSPFQKFNLGQVKKNGRVVGGHSLLTRESLRLAATLPRLGISLGTLLETGKQIFLERRDKSLLARRPVFQAMLYWDLFKARFRAPDPPAFSTFFTNHVAGIMHRYWHHVFPEDFGDLYREGSRRHRKTMDFAMKLVDRILGDAMGFAHANPDLKVVFATSMGQAAILRPEHEGYAASVPSIDRLMSAFGMAPAAYKQLMAMVPQIAVEIADGPARAALIAAMGNSRLASGERAFKVQEIGESLSITVRTPKVQDIKAGGFRLVPVAAGPAPSSGTPEQAEQVVFVTWEDAGIVMNEVEAGTGYHVPQGVMAVYAGEGKGDDARTEIPADCVKALLMEMSGLVPRPEKGRHSALLICS